jgi:hypothetical protein
VVIPTALRQVPPDRDAPFSTGSGERLPEFPPAC